MNETAVARALNVALLLALFVGSAIVYAELPARIPIHFGVAGQADGWLERSWLSWFGLPLVALGTATFLHLTGRWSQRNPQFWNVPAKKRFLALSAEARAPVVAALLAFLSWTSAAVTALFAAIQVFIYRVAVGRADSLPDSFIVIILLFSVGTIAGALRLNSVIRRRILESDRSAVGAAR